MAAMKAHVAGIETALRTEMKTLVSGQGSASPKVSGKEAAMTAEQIEAKVLLLPSSSSSLSSSSSSSSSPSSSF